MVDLRPWPEMVEVLPPLARDRLAALRRSIHIHGISEPVLALPDGRIIDGYHRWQVARELGISPPVTVVDLGEAEAFDLGLARNLARRHLSAEQLAELQQVVHASEERRRAVVARLRRNEQLTQQQVADLVGVSQPTIHNWEDQEASIININNACPPPDCRVSVPRAHYSRIADRAAAGESHEQIAADYGVSRQRISQIVALVNARRTHAPVGEVPLPAGRYRCIVIDPPWPVAKIEREVRPRQGRVLDYPVMSLDEIAALPVADLADPGGCHLYLWVTHRFLPDGLRLVEQWGFHYQCLMTWVKNVGMTPFSWMYSTEHVIFARRGSLDLLRYGLRLDFQARVTRHSAKPEVFYELVSTASPGPRLEMFARVPRDGFTVWGNEVPDGSCPIGLSG